MAIAKVTIESLSTAFAAGQTPTAAEWNDRVFDAHQTEIEAREAVRRAWLALPTLTIVGATDTVTVGNVACVLDGYHLAGDSSTGFIAEANGTYYIQVQADGSIYKALAAHADYLTIGTVDWDGSDLTNATVTAALGEEDAGGDVTGPAGATDANLAAYDGATGKVIKDSAITMVNAADAVTKKHTQNSDTHTTAASFGINGTTTLLRISGGVTQQSVDSGANWTNVGAAGSGDVVGPASSTAGYLATYADASGKVLAVLAVAGSAVEDAVDASHVHANQTELDAITGAETTHLTDTANPHTVTATQVGKATAQWNADKLQDSPVSATAPGVGEVLAWDGAAWTPAAAVLKSLGLAKGDLLVWTGSGTAVRLVVGTDGHVLTADSAQTAGVKWAAASGGLLNKLDATAAPAVTDDSGDGYAVGSLWVDVTNDNAYICEDATVGAAVWAQIDVTTVDITGATETIDTPDGANDYLLVYDHSNSANRKIKLNNLAKAKRTIVLPAGGGWPSAIGPCGAAAQTSTSPVSYVALPFDPDTDEYAQWAIMLPDDYDGGTVTAKVCWIGGTTPSNAGTVCWLVAGVATGDDDLMSTGYGTAQSVTDTCIDGDILITAETSAITIGGTPQPGDLVTIRVMRDVSEDTLNCDAALLAVKLEYSVNAWSA